jgi:serine/threonine protein phosphatase PrpC
MDGHGGGDVADAIHKTLRLRASSTSFAALFADLHGACTLQCCGSTLNMVVVEGAEVSCASVGDSRAVLVTRQSVVPLSYDHRPGVVPGLAVSRAIGDLMFGVSCEPEVVRVTLDPDTRPAFVVVCSDGVWDVLSNDDVAAIVDAAGSTEAATAALYSAAVSRHSRDNITACVWRIR